MNKRQADKLCSGDTVAYLREGRECRGVVVRRQKNGKRFHPSWYPVFKIRSDIDTEWVQHAILRNR